MAHLLLLPSCCVLPPMAAAGPSMPSDVWKIVMHTAHWLLLLGNAACWSSLQMDLLAAVASFCMFTG